MPSPAQTAELENPFNLENPAILDLAPPAPTSVDDTGLKLGLLADLALKFFYYQGMATGAEVADQVKLPWGGVVEHVIDHLATEKLVDLRGGKGFGRVSVDFQLTEKGREYARDALSRTTYVGPAPIPIEQYNALITQQTRETPTVSRLIAMIREMEAGTRDFGNANLDALMETAA